MIDPETSDLGHIFESNRSDVSAAKISFEFCRECDKQFLEDTGDQVLVAIRNFELIVAVLFLDAFCCVFNEIE